MWVPYLRAMSIIIFLSSKCFRFYISTVIIIFLFFSFMSRLIVEYQALWQLVLSVCFDRKLTYIYNKIADTVQACHKYNKKSDNLATSLSIRLSCHTFCLHIQYENVLWVSYKIITGTQGKWLLQNNNN